jgi:ABC-type protease/lipase transport system fused ATPase/permease subunit
MKHHKPNLYQDKGETVLDRVLKQSRVAFVWVGIFSFFLNLLMLAAPIYMLQLYDRVLSSSSLETLIYLSIIVAVAYCVLGLLDVVRNYILSRLGSWFDQQLHGNAIESAIYARIQGSSEGAQALRESIRCATLSAHRP